MLGAGEDTLGELVSQNTYPCAGAVVPSAGRHFGCGQTALSFTYLRVTQVWGRRPPAARRGVALGERRALLRQLTITVQPRTGLSLSFFKQNWKGLETQNQIFSTPNLLDSIHQLALFAPKATFFFFIHGLSYFLFLRKLTEEEADS